MVGNPIHRWKRPVSKVLGKKRPAQDPAKPFANRKHDARKSKIPFGERKFWDKPARPAADKSYFKKDVRKSAKPARWFGDETRFGDQKSFADKKPYGAKPSFRDNPYFQKPQKESDRPTYGHPAKWDKKNKPARSAKSYGAKPQGQRHENANSFGRPWARPQRHTRSIQAKK